MVGGGMGSFWSFFALLALVSAGPLQRYPRESDDYQNDLSAYANYTANEVCFSEGEVFQKGDMMPNPGPCEECRCEPPSIVCNMIKCPVNNNGCRTIQRANHCCPNYNCECDYSGQLYNDGERLELPEEPCQVCYCKGGEVMCNSITCYHRDDCDPIQVPGQCCPKYENCPVRDMASSSYDDKNVLVRSTNKTNPIPPKREMNPWLLTKLPPVSSSSPPKNPQDPTTEGGNIIIVSDWLTERKTTTEDATSSVDERADYNFNYTDEPDLFTNSYHLTTDLKQDFSSDGTMIIKNSDNITPLDEVIFTRIDAPKQNKEVNLEEPTSISSKDTQNKLKTILVRGNSTDGNITEAPFNSTTIDEDLKELSSTLNLPEKQNLLEVGPLETTGDIQTPTEPPVKIQEAMINDKSIISTETPIYTSTLNFASEANENSSDSTTTPFNIYLTEKIPTVNVEKDIMAENVFGISPIEKYFQEDIEQETTTKDLLGSHTTERGQSAPDIYEATENALEDQTKEGSKVGKVKISLNEVKTTLDGLSGTTTNSETDTDVTTPIFTEAILEKDNLNKQDFATELPKIKKDNLLISNKSEMAVSPAVDQEANSTRKNTLFLGTEDTETIYPSEIKIERNNFNSSDTPKGSTQQTGSSILLNNNGSTIPVTTQETKIVSEFNLKSPNVISNNTNLNVNEDPSIGMAKDFALPTLVSLGDDSDDGLESTSDSPPVLELNSHVPFLQLGGHENTDSGMNTFGENYRTTVTNDKYIEVVDKDSVSNLTSNSFDNYGLILRQINSTDDTQRLKISRDDKNNQPTSQEFKTHNGENDQVEAESTTDLNFSTSHIPLTPGDLKVIAEYLINDTIKTVPVTNASEYVSNPWLKGNLTSEEKMSSILSAANISIAIMNKTNDKANILTTETTTRPGEAIRLEKFEKDKLLLGNGALNDLKIGNKTGFIQGKSSEYLDSPKINSEPEIPLNDEAKESVADKATESPNNIKQPTVQNTTPNIDEISTAKHHINDIKPINKNYTQSRSSTTQSTNKESVLHDSLDNNLRFDNVNPADKAETNQYAQNNIFRNEKLSDFTTAPVTSSHPQKQLTP